MTEYESNITRYRRALAKAMSSVPQPEDPLDRLFARFGSLSGKEGQLMAMQYFREEMMRILGVEKAAFFHRRSEGWSQLVRDCLDPAVEKGLIEPWLIYELESADGIVRFDRPDGSHFFAVVEMANGVNDLDRLRSTLRAEILHVATGAEVVPFVVGETQLERGPDVPDVPFIEFIFRPRKLRACKSDHWAGLQPESPSSWRLPGEGSAH